MDIAGSFGAAWVGANNDRVLNRLLMVLIVALFAIDAYILWVGLAHDLDDLYGFRQAQTAITAYWLVKEPHFLAYQMPSLGYPWSVPFEFPVYQWIVYLLAKAGMPLVPAGRIVSFIFSVGCLVPIKILMDEFRLPLRSFLIFAVLYLACPFCTFWARTFMIESTALFFSLCWLAAFIVHRRGGAMLPAILSLICGSLAILSKTTTFLGIGTVAGCFVALDLLRWFKHRTPPIRRIAIGICLCFIPLLVGYVWVEISDHIKSANSYGAMLDSKKLMLWNFGPPGQRLQLPQLFARSLQQDFGDLWVFAALALGLSLLTRYRFVVALTAGVYLVGFLLFTNLHLIHAYYQASIAIFIVVAVGIAINALYESRQKLVAVALFSVILFSQLQFFNEFYWPYITSDRTGGVVIQAALKAKAITSEKQGVLVFGADWSSVIPFYSQRKSLAVPRWSPIPMATRILADPSPFFGEVTVGAVVSCKSGPYNAKDQVEAYLSRLRVVYEGDCTVFAPASDHG
jgi:hypothetical protein